jgi:Skp family chaperone for outer membrane proteins
MRKRTVIAAAALVALTAAYVERRLQANQAGPGPAGGAPTRIAFVNIETVFQRYEKAKLYKTEMDKALRGPKAEAEKLKKEIARLEGEIKIGNPAEKEGLERALAKNKTKLEKLERTAGAMVAKKNEKQAPELFKDLHRAVAAYAKTHGIDAVLTYADVSQAELFSYANVARKIQGMEAHGCTTPLYLAPGLDISLAIAESLNRAYKAGVAK